MKYLIIALLWTGYCILHSYLISIRVTNTMKQLLRKYYAFYRLFYVFISTVLLIPILSYVSKTDQQVIITYGPILNFSRYVLISGSLFLFFWAFFIDYDFLSFIGIRQILNMGKYGKTIPSIELKRKGLLGIIRHPMYLAAIILLWCFTFKVSDIVANTVLTIYIATGTVLEEKKLVLEFGESYIKYQLEVPMLIPFTKSKNN
jgi:methanethiol S-methyltransferase